MTVSRKIVDLWQACRSEAINCDVFSPVGELKLQSLPEYGFAYESLVKHTDNPHMAILLALRSLEIQKSELADKMCDTELAITAPPSTVSSAVQRSSSFAK